MYSWNIPIVVRNIAGRIPKLINKYAVVNSSAVFASAPVASVIHEFIFFCTFNFWNV